MTYRRNYDIYDKTNWLDHGPQKECQGLILDSFLGVTSSKKLEIQQLVLGKYSKFMFDNDTDIIFDRNSKSIMNCVAINGSEMKMQYWSNPYNWITKDAEENAAIPNLERLPCQYDEVVFPKGILTGAVVIGSTVKVKRLKFGDEYWTKDDVKEYDKHPYLEETLGLYHGAELLITEEDCADPSGCVCGNEADVYLCTFNLGQSTECDNPILLTGFCYAICGAGITFKPKDNFKIAVIERKLKEYRSDSYVSKVNKKDGPYIQIVFTEKEFSGNSIEEARTLYRYLQADGTLNVNESTLLYSSYNYSKATGVRNAMATIFGSLLAVCVVFSLLYLLFGDEQKSRSFRERLGLGTRPLTYRSLFYSRNSVGEGTGLIMEGQSMVGSLQNIPKSFENPTFAESKKKSPSTTSSIANSEEDLNEESKNDEIHQRTFEDIDTRELIESVAEEGELVDLSDRT